MKYLGCLLAVKDMMVSKDFYQQVLHQEVTMDLGVHVAFGGSFSLQQEYPELIGVSPNTIKTRSHNAQIYFEVENLDDSYQELKQHADLKWVHGIQEYPWGQRGFRIYDPDDHIIEIAEDTAAVIRRFADQGLSLEEISRRSMYPVEMVREFLSE